MIRHCTIRQQEVEEEKQRKKADLRHSLLKISVSAIKKREADLQIIAFSEKAFKGERFVFSEKGKTKKP